MGGVIDGSVVDSSYTYGVNQSTTLHFNGLQFDAAVGAPASSPIPISGSQAFMFATGATSQRFLSTKITGIDNGLPGEEVVAIGLTVLSTGVDYGTMTLSGFVTAQSPTSIVNSASGQGDTLFALRAPPGQGFEGFILSYTGTLGPNDRMWIDDVAFVTAQVPEPSSLILAAFGIAGLAVWGWRFKRPGVR